MLTLATFVRVSLALLVVLAVVLYATQDDGGNKSK